MSKWISFSDLLKRWDIQQFELLNYLKDGLQPYLVISGISMECPQFCHAGYINESIIKSGLEILSNTKGRNLNKWERLSVLSKENAEIELQRIEKDDHSFISWKWLELKLSKDDYQKLYSCLDKAVFKIDDVLKFEKKFKLNQKKEKKNVTNNQTVFPCKPGTEWGKVEIALVADDMVRIKTPQGEGRFTYHKLNMQDARVGDRPKKVWVILKLFATYNGRLDHGIEESAKRILSNDFNIDFYRKLPEYTKVLNKKLQEIFGIKDSIFKYHYNKHKAYITKIKFSDHRHIESSKFNIEKTLHETEVKNIQNKLGISDLKRFDG